MIDGKEIVQVLAIQGGKAPHRQTGRGSRSSQQGPVTTRKGRAFKISCGEEPIWGVVKEEHRLLLLNRQLRHVPEASLLELGNHLFRQGERRKPLRHEAELQITFIISPYAQECTLAQIGLTVMIHSMISTALPPLGRSNKLVASSNRSNRLSP
jgi:hypothetical protein